MACLSSDVSANKSRFSQAFEEASDCKSKQQFTALFNFFSAEGVKPIDARGNTILHVVAMHGNVFAFQKLDSLLTSKSLKTKNHKGDTVLHEAARFGHNEVVKFLFTKEIALLSECNNDGETPLYVAAACGKEEVFNTLAQQNHSQEAMTRNDDSTVLHAAMKGEYYSLAGRIVESFSGIIGKYDKNGSTPLDLLAKKPESFKSGSPYAPRNLGLMPWFPLQLLGMLLYHLIPPTVVRRNHAGHDEENQHGKNGTSTSPLLKKLISGFRSCILVVPWLREIDDARQKHALAIELAKTLVSKEKDWTRYSSGEKWDTKSTTEPTQGLLVQATENGIIELVKVILGRLLAAAHTLDKNAKNKILHLDSTGNFEIVEVNSRTADKVVQNPLVQAVDNGIIEIVEQIIGKFPDAAYSFDMGGKNILHVAVEHKDRSIYEYLKKKIKKDHKDKMLAEIVDNQGNNILHLAAKSENPRFILGPVNHMTGDICWFKRVWFDCPSHFDHLENSNGQTPLQMFEQNHSELRAEAEKAMKDMNSGLMLLTTLIGTVNYAALFTPPGDYNDDGAPRLLDDKHTRHDMMMFLWYISMALFSSLFALVTMLSIQLCRFRTNDFYMGLPFRFLSAMIGLCLSAVFTITACFQAYVLDRITFNPHLYFWPACSIMILYFTDAMYLTISYMCHAIFHSFFYTSEETHVFY